MPRQYQVPDPVCVVIPVKAAENDRWIPGQFVRSFLPIGPESSARHDSPRVKAPESQRQDDRNSNLRPFACAHRVASLLVAPTSGTAFLANS